MSARGIHKLPPVACADSCTVAQSDNDVYLIFHYYEAEGTALNIHDKNWSSTLKNDPVPEVRQTSGGL
eukprot:1593018-Pyramimonas_sp.AAC.1